LKVLVNSVSASQLNLTPHTAAGSIFGQTALPYPDEITVGAISASGASNGNDTIESYSSQGPVFMSQPATGTSTRMKPDFVGVDCVNVTGVGGFGTNFCGTSAAAPHIAGLIALLESGYPQQNPYTLLKNGAKHLGTGYPNGVYGYGLVNVLASVASLYPAPSASITSPGANAALNTGQAITFSSNCSSNGAPGSMKALWNFGGGSNIPDSTQPNPTVTYSGGGVFTVTLTCSNAFGASASATRSITVNVATSTSTGGGGGLGFLSLLALLIAVWAARLPRAKSILPTTSGIFMQ
ncbi:MAG: PKD domain-containing protein, partial [Gammaproteobacteria bacterium]